MDSADGLQLAFGTSHLAAELALAHFESGVSATLKADATPVTEADRAVELLLRETLSQARPEDAFLGDDFLAERYHKWDHAPWVLLVEEAGGRFTDRKGAQAEQSEARWIDEGIDPGDLSASDRDRHHGEHPPGWRYHGSRRAIDERWPDERGELGVGGGVGRYGLCGTRTLSATARTDFAPAKLKPAA